MSLIVIIYFEVDAVLLGGLLGDLSDKPRVLALSLITELTLGTTFDTVKLMLPVSRKEHALTLLFLAPYVSMQFGEIHKDVC